MRKTETVRLTKGICTFFFLLPFNTSLSPASQAREVPLCYLLYVYVLQSRVERFLLLWMSPSLHSVFNSFLFAVREKRTDESNPCTKLAELYSCRECTVPFIGLPYLKETTVVHNLTQLDWMTSQWSFPVPLSSCSIKWLQKHWWMKDDWK